ncbi:MAG: anion transporter [Acidobacteria bacterium]|nr:anion transporter [Acidobacteriota bacterium]
MLVAGLIFAATYLVVAIGRLPGFRVDRTGAAIIGATLMIATDVLTFEEAYRAVDYDTLILLFGMMIVVANLRLSGFFRLVGAWAVEHAHRPVVLLAAVVWVTGVFSALFVNDTMCLVMTPLVLEVSLTLGRNPVPFLLAVAMGSNIGSVATITGNPQNMLIGSYSRIPYTVFLKSLAPVALIGLVITVGWIAFVYREELRSAGRLAAAHPRVRLNRVLMAKSLGVSLLMIAGFFVGWPVSKVALVAGAVLLLTRRVKPERVYHEIDWQLLVMFTGLFIVVAGIEKTVLAHYAPSAVASLHLDRLPVLSVVTAVLSNLVSNVPAVLVFKPLVAHLADPQRSWLTLAMASTLSGNFTVLGSVANLIVVERAKRDAPIGFMEYFRVGAPLTVMTLAIGVLLLRSS